MRIFERLLVVFLTSAILLFSFAIFIHPITAITQDLGRHLKLGEIIWQTKNVPDTNLFSYTEPSHSFINHHWGSEVIFYLVQRFSGWNGLILLKVSVVMTSLVILYILASRRSSLWATVIAASVYVPVLLERTSVRPEIFGYLFTSVMLWLIYGTDKRDKCYRNKPLCLSWRKIFMIGIIQLLWVNLHISFIFGWMLTGFFVADQIICKLLKKTDLRDWKYWRAVLSPLVIVIFVSVINPNGIRGMLEPFRIFENYGYKIVENQNIFFLSRFTRNPNISFFFIAVSVLMFGWLWRLETLRVLKSPKRFLIFDGLVSIVFTALAFWEIRNFPFFVLATFPIASKGIMLVRSWFEELLDRSKNSIWHYLPAIITSVLLLWIGSFLIAVVNRSFYRQYSREEQVGFGVVRGSKGAADFFLNNQLSGPIFNNFDIGSYLIYRLYPKKQVFVDGRPEAYTASFFQSIYIPMQQDRIVWNKMVKKYGFQTIIFSHTDMTPWGQVFINSIVHDGLWETVYLDEKMIILVKRGGKNQIVQSRYGFDPSQLRNPQMLTTVSKTYISYLRIAHFFSLIGRQDLSQWYLNQSSFLL